MLFCAAWFRLLLYCWVWMLLLFGLGGGLLLLSWSGGEYDRCWLLLVWLGRGDRVSFQLLAMWLGGDYGRKMEEGTNGAKNNDSSEHDGLLTCRCSIVLGQDSR